MNDDVVFLAPSHANLKQLTVLARADQHSKAVIQDPHSNSISVGMLSVRLRNSMTKRAGREFHGQSYLSGLATSS